MKEIDKIRIRQWNQDNPYIQMKNLENAQPGYRVHTVNDDHHLYELPLETQNIILDWVFWNFYPAQKIYPHLTSDDLKEVLYKRTQIHLYNNQFKPFWPSNGQEVLCSEECKTINRNQRQLAYYHRKQSGQKAGEAI